MSLPVSSRASAMQIQDKENFLVLSKIAGVIEEKCSSRLRFVGIAVIVHCCSIAVGATLLQWRRVASDAGNVFVLWCCLGCASKYQCCDGNDNQ